MLTILMVGAGASTAAIDVMVKRAHDRAIERARVHAEAVAGQVAEIRATFDALACQRSRIAADDLRQRIEMAVLFGCRGCGAKPREVVDVVVRCGDASLALDHPDRFSIGCVRCVPAATRVRA